MITVIVGENFYIRKQKLSQIKNAFTTNNSIDYSIEQFDASEVEYNKIIDSIKNLSLFSQDKLIIVNNFTANKDLIDKTESFISAIPPGVEIVLIAEKVDKRTSAYGLLKKSATIIDCTAPASINRWIEDEVKRQGGLISSHDAQLLVERMGANQTLLAQEIEKLLLFNSTISRESIELLTVPVPQSSVFQLLDAAFSGKKKQVAKLYKEQREMKVEPLAIIGMITWQLYVLAVVKAAEQKGVSDVAKQAKLNPYVVSKSQQLVKGHTLSTIRSMLKNLLTLETRLKTQSIDGDDALQLFLLTELR